LTKLNDATDSISTTYGNPTATLGLSIVGTSFVGTVVLERSIDGGTIYNIVESFLFDTETNVYDRIEGVVYRLRCSAFTSGSAVVTLYR